MGRIQEPGLRALVDRWSPCVVKHLKQIGEQKWPPLKERRGLLAKPHIVPRFVLEGPAPFGDAVAWAISHTSRPSTFDDRGLLTKGKREFWLLLLHPGDQPSFEIRGAQTIDGIPLNEKALREALSQALATGPKVESFFGNKGPISQR